MFVSFSGSGKSYLAKMLRDLEVENGGDAPRIHSMDDYFMTEVEKVVEYSYWIYINDKAFLSCHMRF
jgi:pantothenate kinase-related protein Tda10